MTSSSSYLQKKKCRRFMDYILLYKMIDGYIM
jgi:hypothetical protein